MPEELRIAIRYDGPSVDDGTMPVADVVSALQGFSSAYGKIAVERYPSVEHQLRVSEINKSSFELVVLAWVLLGQTSSQLQAINVIGGTSRWIVSGIAKYIAAKKHTRNQPYTVKVDGKNNTVVLINMDGANLAIPPDYFKLFESKLIDADLNRIVESLESGSVNRARITAHDGGAPEDPAPIQEEITSRDKTYFEPPVEEAVTSSKTAQLEGFFVSLNKENNRGTFRLPDGTHIPYRYIGKSPHTLHQVFAYRGPVRVDCIATFDKNLQPIRIDVKAAHRLQKSLF